MTNKFETFESFVTWLGNNRYCQQLEGDFNFDDETMTESGWDASCPCSKFEVTVAGHKLKCATRCWRVSDHKRQGCQELIIDSESNPEEIAPIVEALLKNLDDQEWYNKYMVTYSILDFINW